MIEEELPDLVMQLQADGENPVQELTSVLAAEYPFALVCHASGGTPPLLPLQVRGGTPPPRLPLRVSGGTPPSFALVCHCKWRHHLSSPRLPSSS